MAFWFVDVTTERGRQASALGGAVAALTMGLILMVRLAAFLARQTLPISNTFAVIFVLTGLIGLAFVTAWQLLRRRGLAPVSISLGVTMAGLTLNLYWVGIGWTTFYLAVTAWGLANGLRAARAARDNPLFDAEKLEGIFE
jgi:hypothetical protein